MMIADMLRTCLRRLNIQERRAFRRMYLLLALDAFLQLAPASVIGWALVILMQRGMSTTELWIYGSLPLLLLLLRIPLLICIQSLGFRCGFRAGQELREMALDRLRALPLGSLSMFKPGMTAALLTEEVGVVENFLAWHAAILYGYLINACLLLGALTLTDYRLGLLAVLLAAGLLPLLRLARRFVGDVHRRRREQLDHGGEIINEFVRGMPVLRVFNAAERQTALFTDTVKALHRYADSTMKRVIPWLGAGRAWLELSLVGVMAGAAALYLHSELSLIQLTLVLIFAIMLATPLDLLLSNAVFLGMAQEAYNKLQPLLTSAPLVEPDSPQFPNDNGIVWQNVSFGFQPGRHLFSNVNFSVPPGSFTAIVGPSGAGKSTLLHLLARAWDVDEGTIRLGGVDIRAMSLDTLFDNVAIVYQQGLWLQDTIMGNIRMGRPEAGDDEVIAAAQAACADDFIRCLPQGYQTRLTDAQSCLSGGELQRISIARAILKNAPVVLLDEATSALDAENEYTIQRALSRLCRGKTVLMVAHRLNTVTHADQILVMEEGRLAAQGDHVSLLATCALYQRLWLCQQEAERWFFTSSVDQYHEK